MTAGEKQPMPERPGWYRAKLDSAILESLIRKKHIKRHLASRGLAVGVPIILEKPVAIAATSIQGSNSFEKSSPDGIQSAFQMIANKSRNPLDFSD